MSHPNMSTESREVKRAGRRPPMATTMDELESELLLRCGEMRAGAERLLIGLESGLFDHMPLSGEHLRRLAESTLRAVDQYESDYERDKKTHRV
jgi:hypothetical protein